MSVVICNHSTYNEPLQSMLNPCSATKEQKEAWSAFDDLLHQKIGGSSYAVVLDERRGTVEETFAPLAAKLCNERTKMPRVIIFCRRCEDCASIYDFFLSTLKHEFTEPISAPNVSKFRLVDMYTSVTQ